MSKPPPPPEGFTVRGLADTRFRHNWLPVEAPWYACQLCLLRGTTRQGLRRFLQSNFIVCDKCLTFCSSSLFQRRVVLAIWRALWWTQSERTRRSYVAPPSGASDTIHSATG